MVRKEVTLQNKDGLHARPASLFVMKASKFASDITVFKSDKEYNAKSIMGLLTMSAKKGEAIIIQARGNDEEFAVEELYKLVCEIED